MYNYALISVKLQFQNNVLKIQKGRRIHIQEDNTQLICLYRQEVNVDFLLQIFTTFNRQIHRLADLDMVPIEKPVRTVY